APHEEGTETLLAEWHSLRLLSGSGVAPALLVPDHEPRQFLLIEYVRGSSAHDLLESGADGHEVFHLMGRALVDLHRTPVERFGALAGAEGVGWEEHTRRKILSDLQVCRGILPGDLH